MFSSGEMNVYVHVAQGASERPSVSLIITAETRTLHSLYFTFILFFMASDALTSRQPPLPPTYDEPTLSKGRQSSAEPTIVSRALSSDAAARARSASIEPETLTHNTANSASYSSIE